MRVVKRYEFDLSVRRSDFEVEIKARKFYVERCDGNVIVKFEDKQSDYLTLSEGMIIESEYEIKRIYISNASATGKLVIVAYNDIQIKT